MLIVGVVAVAAYAQTGNSGSIQLPRVFVTDLNVESVTSDGLLTGTFVARNDENIPLSDLKYQIFIMAPREDVPEAGFYADSGPLYSHAIVDTPVNMLPQQTKTVPFEYAVPDLPQGEYRVRVQFVTSQGWGLGWQDTTIQLGTPGAVFVTLEEQGIMIENAEVQAPDSGPTLTAGSTVQFALQASNNSTGAVTLIPHMTVYRWGVVKEKVNTSALPAISIPGRGVTEHRFSFTAPLVPDAYQVYVTLKDETGRVTSSRAAFRVVVGGESAKVFTAHFKKLAVYKGTEAVIEAGVVGPADQVSTVNASVVVSMLDAGEVVAEQTVPVALNAAAQTIEATLPLARDVAQPGLRVTITSAQGAVLDTYETLFTLPLDVLQTVAVPETTAPSWKNKWLALGLLIAAVVILIVFILMRAVKKKAQPPVLPTAGTLVLLVVAGIVFLQHSASAQIHVYRTSDSFINIFVNRPANNSFYDAHAIPYEVSANVIACANAATGGGVRIYTSTDGQHYANFPFPGMVLKQSPDFRTSCPKKTCPYTYNYFGTVPGQPDVAKTTVMFEGWYERALGAAGSKDVWASWVYHYVPPKGDINEISCTEIRGWTCDPNNYQAPLRVDILSDGQLISSTTANQYRSDVAQLYSACQGSGDHGFTVPIPKTLYDNKPRTISAYVYDLDTGGHNVTLPNAKTIQCAFQCSDGKDNDADGLIDTADPGCHSDGNPENSNSYVPTDDDETHSIISNPQPPTLDVESTSPSPSIIPNTPDCSDGVDNDGDGLVDSQDPGCHTDGNTNNSNSYTPGDSDESRTGQQTATPTPTNSVPTPSNDIPPQDTPTPAPTFKPGVFHEVD